MERLKKNVAGQGIIISNFQNNARLFKRVRPLTFFQITTDPKIVRKSLDSLHSSDYFDSGYIDVTNKKYFKVFPK